MDTQNRHERLLAQAVTELRDCPEIAVSRDDLVVEADAEGVNGMSSAQLAEEAMEAAALVSELEHVTIDHAVVEGSPRFRNVSSHWRATKSAETLTGEFRVPQFYRAIFEPALPLVHDGSSGEERELLAQLRRIDGQPRSGTGLMSAVRLRPKANPLEIWVWDARIGPMRMDLDYLGYLEALSVTKGVYGWQYLYTDAYLGADDFHHFAASVEAMMRLFPELFPHHDYTPLRIRLEERR